MGGMVQKKTPLGVKFISIVDILIGVIYFLMSWVWGVSGKMPLTGWFFYLPFSISIIWLGISTFRLKPFAAVINKVLSIIGIMGVIGVYGLLSHQPPYFRDPNKCKNLFIICCIVVLYFVTVLFYLNRPGIKEQFKLRKG